MPLPSLSQKLRRVNPEHHLARLRSAFEKAGNRDAEIEAATAPLSWWRERWGDAAIRREFIESFLKIRDGFDGKKLKLLKLNEAQAYLHAHPARKRVEIKCRKLGQSTYHLAEFFADAVVLSGCTIVLVAHDPQLTDEFFAVLKTMYECLPPHIKPFTRYYSKELIHFHDPAKDVTDSRIYTMTVAPGHEDKSRGQTPTHLLLSEVPSWRGDAQKFAVSAIQSAAPDAKIVIDTTPKGLDFTYQTYMKGKRGEGGWVSNFFPWWFNRHYRIEGAEFFQRDGQTWVRYVDDNGQQEAALDDRLHKIAKVIFRWLCQHQYIGRSAGYMCDDVAAYLAWRNHKVTDIGEESFRSEYPENDRDCFELTGRPVVPARYLKVNHKPAGPKEGRDYLVVCDPSKGTEAGNPAAVQVIDLLTGLQAREEELKLRADLLGARLCEISDEYNGAMIVVEVNGLGLATVLEVERLGYGERLFRSLTAAQMRRIDDGDSTMQEELAVAPPGFRTTKVNKPLMGAAIEKQLRLGLLALSSEKFCEQAKTVHWNDSGSFAALSGFNDDLFMALAIGAYVREYEMGRQAGYVGAMPEFGTV